MKRILILQNEISNYNVSTYNEISNHYDLTIGYITKDKSCKICSFNKQHFTNFILGPFTFVRGLRSFCNCFDIVCIIPNLRIPSYCLIPFLPHRYKVVNWSIGFRASYTHPYITDRKHVFADSLFQKVLSECDASIFYMEKAKEFWKDTKLDMKKVFVAPNTTDVVPIKLCPEKKKNFLFVGTLYKGKGLDLLLKSYYEAVIAEGIDNKLHIVGAGPEKENLEKYVADNGLKDRVVFHGAIFDEKKLAECFSNALLCISPTQGGLSVPKSMGYGVPFVTRTDAITGGEIYHIIPDVNGIIFEKDEDLTQILLDASRSPQKYVDMGIMAKSYYDNNATIKHMARGAMDAFEYVLNQ